MFRGKKILVTGATGTIGKVLVQKLLAQEIKSMHCLDHNETEVFFIDEKYKEDDRVKVHFGDVRDADRIEEVAKGIDIIFHTAALKHVIVCENSPFDAVQTNIIGVKNIINSAMKNNVGKVIFTSSDKAVNPTNVMGTTKLMGERLITAANNTSSGQKTIFSSTRFGNVLGSRGSVLEIFKEQIKLNKPVTLTDESMSRFVMTADQAVDLVLEAASIARGGEVFVTKMPVVLIKDLAMATINILSDRYQSDRKKIGIKTTGVKSGEKIYEELLNEEELRRTIELPHHYVVLPAFRSLYASIDYSFPQQIEATFDKPYRSDLEDALTLSEVEDFLTSQKLL